MSTTVENYCEQIAILCLQGQAGLSGFAIVPFDKDTATDKDRIIVKANPREAAVPGIAGGTPSIWRVPVEVTVFYKAASASDFDAKIAEVEAAFSDSTTPPAGAVALADAQFTGLKINFTDSANRDHGDDERERMRTFNFLVQP